MPFSNNRIGYIINLINPKKTDRILNIGVSNIPEIEMGIGNKVKECWTIDLDKDKLEKASKYLKKSKLIEGDLMKYSGFKKNYFDKIIILEVLEHLDDDVGAVRIIKSLLKKNGEIIASVPNKNLLHLINPVKYFQHKRHYSNKDVLNLLKSNKFKINHFNVVENWTLLANLYIHLLFKYVFKRNIQFVTIKNKKRSTYLRYNKSGLDIVVRASKIS